MSVRVHLITKPGRTACGMRVTDRIAYTGDERVASCPKCLIASSPAQPEQSRGTGE